MVLVATAINIITISNNKAQLSPSQGVTQANMLYLLW